MAENVKMLRANVGIYLAYPEAFADPSNPTAAELNDQFVYGTNEDGMVFNISCAVLDDYTMNMSDPEMDDSISVCDIGNVETPTFDTYEVELNFFRDEDVDALGVYNLARDLHLGVDRPFYAIKRIGKAQNAQFLTDGSDVISMYGVSTDYPVDVADDNAMLQFGGRYKTTGSLNTNYIVTA